MSVFGCGEESPVVSKESIPGLKSPSCVATKPEYWSSRKPAVEKSVMTGTDEPDVGFEGFEIHSQERCSLRLFLVMESPLLPFDRHSTNLMVDALEGLCCGGVGRVVSVVQ